MIRPADLLKRADDQTLSDLIGPTAMRLMMSLDPKLATPTHLRQMVIDLHGEASLILDPRTRALLTDLLKPDQALALANELGLSGSDPYQALREARIPKNSDKEDHLLRFFEVTQPVEEASDETPSNAAARYPLFDYQRHAVREVQGHLARSPYRVVLHMPTGAGKTRTAMNIIAEHMRQHEPTVVVWLAYSEELCEQAASEFRRAWEALGNREVRLWRFWGGYDELSSAELRDGLVVAGLSKTYSATMSRIQFIVQLARASSLVIIDEAHSAIAETYRRVLDALVVQRQHTGLLGLTATPGRTWADIAVDEELATFFNRQKVTLHIPGYANPVDYLTREGYLAHVTYKPLLYQPGFELSEGDKTLVRQNLDVPDKILRLLANDEMRNLSIIAHTEQMIRKHQRILLFAATVEHAEMIAAILRLRGVRAAAVTGKTPSRRRAQLIRDFKSDDETPQVLCNFGVLTTGFDAPRTSAALIARPTKSLVLYSQMVGRAIRGPKAGGNAHAEVATVVDYQLPGFGSVAEAFTNWEDIWE